MRFWTTFRLLSQLSAFLLIGGAAWANECDGLLQVAQQNLALYRSGGDPANFAAYQTQQNGYIACMNSANSRADPMPSPGGRAGAVMNGLSGMMGILGSMGGGGGGNAVQPQAPPAIDYAELQREQEQHEQQQREQAAREQRQRDEQARLAALETDRRARCATPNSFGASSGCGVAANPFATSSVPSAARNPFATTSAPSAARNPFATSGASAPAINPPATRGASGKKAQVANQSGASSLPATQGSVPTQDCPAASITNCSSDGAQAMLVGARCLNALQSGHYEPACQYGPTNYSSAVLSVEQYKQIPSQYGAIPRGNAIFDPDVRAYLNQYYLPYQVPTPDDPGVVYYEPSQGQPFGWGSPDTQPAQTVGQNTVSPTTDLGALTTSQQAAATAAYLNKLIDLDRQQQQSMGPLSDSPTQTGDSNEGQTGADNLASPAQTAAPTAKPATDTAKDPCDYDRHSVDFTDPVQVAKADACSRSLGHY